MTDTSIFPTVNRPCPDWCTLAPGHGWDGADIGTVTRGHGGILARTERWTVELYLLEKADAQVVLDEHGRWEDIEGQPGPSQYPDGPLIDIGPPAAGSELMTGPEARALAAALLEAADAWDKATR